MVSKLQVELKKDENLLHDVEGKLKDSTVKVHELGDACALPRMPSPHFCFRKLEVFPCICECPAARRVRVWPNRRRVVGGAQVVLLSGGAGRYEHEHERLADARRHEEELEHNLEHEHEQLQAMLHGEACGQVVNALQELLLREGGLQALMTALPDDAKDRLLQELLISCRHDPEQVLRAPTAAGIDDLTEITAGLIAKAMADGADRDVLLTALGLDEAVHEVSKRTIMPLLVRFGHAAKQKTMELLTVCPHDAPQPPSPPAPFARAEDNRFPFLPFRSSLDCGASVAHPPVSRAPCEAGRAPRPGARAPGLPCSPCVAPCGEREMTMNKTRPRRTRVQAEAATLSSALRSQIRERWKVLQELKDMEAELDKLRLSEAQLRQDADVATARPAPVYLAVPCASRSCASRSCASRLLLAQEVTRGAHGGRV